MFIKNLIMAILLAVTAIACTKKNNNQKDNQETKYDLTFEIELTPADGTEKSQAEKVSLVDFNTKNTIFKDHDEKVKNLIERIKSKKTVNFEEITDLLIELHSLTAQLDATYNHKSTDAALNASQIDALVDQLAETSKTEDVLSKKLKYEEKLIEINKSEIKYNKDAVTLSQVLSENRQQCYSGTSLNVVVARESSTVESYRTSKNVVIYTNGHILPGKFVTLQKKQNLVGIETTEEGQALKMFYDINDSYNYAGASNAIRVVDAELFVLYEVIKNYISYAPELLVKKLKDKNINLDKKVIFQLALQNGCGIIDPIALSIFEKTAQKYGLNKNLIPTSKEDEVSLESCAYSIQQKLSDEVSVSQKSIRLNAQLNLSALGFGSSDVADGDIERSKSTTQTLGENITADELKRLAEPVKASGTIHSFSPENGFEIFNLNIEELDSQCKKIRKTFYSSEDKIKVGSNEKYTYMSFYNINNSYERSKIIHKIAISWTPEHPFYSIRHLSFDSFQRNRIEVPIFPSVFIDIRTGQAPAYLQTSAHGMMYGQNYEDSNTNNVDQQIPYDILAEESKYWCIAVYNTPSENPDDSAQIKAFCAKHSDPSHEKTYNQCLRDCERQKFLCK